MFKKVVFCFCGFLLSAIVTQDNYAMENSSIKPAQLERDLNVLGLKIGDSLEEVRTKINGVLNPNQTIEEKNYSTDNTVTQIWINYEDRQDYSKSKLILYLTEKRAGNALYGLVYEHAQSPNKPISLENFIAELRSKYGKESEYYSSNIGLYDQLFWALDSNGGIQKIEYKKLKSHEIYCLTPDKDAGLQNPKQHCKGKSLTSTISKNGEFVSMILMTMIDYDFYFSAIKAAQEKQRGLLEQETKKQLEQSKSNKISF